MLVISGGPAAHRYRTSLSTASDGHPQVHGRIDQGDVPRSRAMTRSCPCLFEAYAIATSGEPGPVFVELPVNILLMTGGDRRIAGTSAASAARRVDAAADITTGGSSCCGRPGIPASLPAGVRADASSELIRLAELSRRTGSNHLAGAVSISRQSSLAMSGFGFGRGRRAVGRKKRLRGMRRDDRGSARGSPRSRPASYGARGAGKNLIHIDINPAVFQRQLSGQGSPLPADADAVLTQLMTETRKPSCPRRALSQSAIARAESRTTRRPIAKAWYRHDAADLVKPRGASSTSCGGRLPGMTAIYRDR